MSKKSTQVALGGMICALCVTLMLLTDLIPFANYALPMMAGALLLLIAAEHGIPAAVRVYVSVSLFSALVVANKEAVMVFICFFGYYPILKRKLDRIRAKAVGWVFKLAVFNGAIILAFIVAENILGIGGALEELGDYGRYSAHMLLALGNIFFVIYDFVLVRYYNQYLYWFRPKLLKR